MAKGVRATIADYKSDPFAGSSTTGLAANLLNRRYLGIEQEEKILDMGKARKIEIEDDSIKEEYLDKLGKQARIFRDKDVRVLNESGIRYSPELPF